MHSNFISLKIKHKLADTSDFISLTYSFLIVSRDLVTSSRLKPKSGFIGLGLFLDENLRVKWEALYFLSLHFRVWYWSSFAPIPFDILVTEWSTSNSFYLNVPYYHFMISRISRSFMPQEIRDWVYIDNFPLGLRASSIILSQVVGFYVTYSLFSEITPFVKIYKNAYSNF